MSGSDDGNWFIWHKKSAQLSDILEGDGTVVNVIEAHPHLPVVAISGIDHTIKVRRATYHLLVDSHLFDSFLLRLTTKDLTRRSALLKVLSSAICKRLKDPFFTQCRLNLPVY